MTTLFNVPMDSIMRVMLAAFVLIAVAIVGLALRNRLLLKLALRNIPRRRAQSILIVLGLMLSTVIVTSAFAAGDTFSYSIRTSAVAGLGGVDETVTRTTVARDSVQAIVRPMPASIVGRVRHAVASGRDVDGVTGAVVVPAPVQDLTSRQTKAAADLTGVPVRYPVAFGSLTTTGGARVSLAQLRGTKAYINDIAAQDLSASVGDRLRIYTHGRPTDLRVAGIVRNEGLAGGGLLDRTAHDPVVLMPLSRVQGMTGYGAQVTQVLISNRGDTLSGASLTPRVIRQLHASAVPYSVHTVKQQALSNANTAGTEFTAGFITFGLFSIAAGVMLIFMLFVMLAAERRPEMGMARAVGTKRRHLIQQFLFEGYVYDLAAATIGVLLGIGLGLLMVDVISVLLQSAGFFSIQSHIEPRSLVVAFCVGALVTFITVAISCWRVSRLNIVAAIRDLQEDSLDGKSVASAFKRPLNDLTMAGRRLRTGRPIGAIRALIASPWHLITASGVFISRGPVPLLAGYLLFSLGVSSRQLFPFSLGISLMLVGGAMVLRWIMAAFHVRDRIRNRIAFSLAGVTLVVYWLLPFDFFRSDLQFGIEMFVLAGIMLTLGGVWTVMYNIDLILGALLLLGGRVGRLAPVLKTAVMYPMQHRFRTGMTLFMFSLVMFALMVQAVLIGSFSVQGLNLNRDVGGYQIYGQVIPANPIRNETVRVATNPVLRGRIVAVGGAGETHVDVSQNLRSWTGDALIAPDDSYFSTTHFTLYSRARRYSGDAQVWHAVRTHPGYAIVDGGLVPTSNGSGGTITGITLAQRTFKPVTIAIREHRGGPMIHLTVVGVLNPGATALGPFSGIYTSRATFTRVPSRWGVTAPPIDTYFFRTGPGASVHATARALGSAFLRNGLDVKEVQAEYNKGQSLQIGFNNLLEAFMGLGLFVGIAALGVIATRSVVERRQQIGVLRAIGFKRRMVQSTFLLESSFVALLGTLVGVGLGLLAGIQVIDYFGKSNPGLHVVIPWVEVLLIVLGTYAASLLTTFLPAWQASRVYPAEAIRYE